jgi:hypothetical protein
VFRFVNETSQPLWVGGQGTDARVGAPIASALTGFKLAPGECKYIQLPDSTVAARYWARTECAQQGDKFVCATGDCGAPLNDFGIECNVIGGQSPASLAEFTLSPDGNDFYDISLVDGYTLGIRMQPLQGTYELAPGVDPQYNCGMGMASMDTSLCPDELQLRSDDGALLGCFSICAAVNNARQRERYPMLQTLYDQKTERGLMRDKLCCACGAPNTGTQELGGCEDLDKACTYGCSPFVTTYTDPRYQDRVCPVIPGTMLPDWPTASNGQNYAEVFKSQAPDAYSWQFDDNQSTYQCRGADYEIAFFE